MDGARFTISRCLGALTILFCFAIRIFWSANTPLQLLYWAANDDGLYITHAQDLLSGHWLGQFSQSTLSKGPGYPIFLALAAGSGLPVTVCQGLFQFLAIAVAAVIITRLTHRSTVGWAAFLILVFLPACFDPSLQRIIREQIYWGQVLMAFLLFAVAMFAPPDLRAARIFVGLVAGMLLAWTWLTREEGVWLIPGYATLVLGAFLRCVPEKRPFRRVFSSVATVLLGFAVIYAAFITANKIAYGSFVGVDFKEHNFQAALAALQSIEDGHMIDYVPVDASARQLAATVSPTFAPLAKDLRPGGPLNNWTKPGCQIYPNTCGDIAGGWFVWALRDAAAANGYYASPRIASQKFGQIAAEINAACDTGKLKCKRSLFFKYIPPMSEQQWLSIPRRLLSALRITSLAGLHPIKAPPPMPADTARGLYKSWMFLNFPKIVGPAPSSLNVNGWFYAAGSTKWPQYRFTDQAGRAVKASVTRRPSPDLIAHFKDKTANMDRFAAVVACPNTCKLHVDFANGSSLKVPLKPRATAQSANKKRTIWIDSVDPTSLYPASQHDPRVKTARKLTNVARCVYSFAFPALLGLGFISLVAGMVRDAFRRKVDPVFITGLAAFILVGTRLLILGIVDASMFPAISMPYVSPAVYLAALASILSISALNGSNPRRKTLPQTLALMILSTKRKIKRQNSN